jgi:hypothetical protein
MIRKLFVFIFVLFMFTTTAFAHPAVPNKPTLPTAAAKGLHRACGNLDPESIAFHVFLYFLSPHMD